MVLHHYSINFYVMVLHHYSINFSLLTTPLVYGGGTCCMSFLHDMLHVLPPWHAACSSPHIIACHMHKTALHVLFSLLSTSAVTYTNIHLSVSISKQLRIRHAVQKFPVDIDSGMLIVLRCWHGTICPARGKYYSWKRVSLNAYQFDHFEHEAGKATAVTNNVLMTLNLWVA